MSNKLIKGTLITSLIFGFLFLFYYFGSFIILFDNNQCYSHVISNIGTEIDKAVKSGQKEDMLKVQKLIDNMPLYGYESNCNDIFETFKSL